jgi:polypeptide N-acetylgalactosaminyltransferase
MQGNQHFNYRVDTKQLYHPTSGQCLDCDPERGEIFMNPCSETVESQKWQWEKVDPKLVAERNAKHGL